MLIREKKRVRGATSFRRVPLSDLLNQVLRDWMQIHPGGKFLFCFDENKILRSRKIRRKGEPVTHDEVHDHFSTTIYGIAWCNMPGWHCLRHSFCSNCAAAGVEQRVINSWVGHQTEEMVRRYRHLFPSKEIEAIRTVFR